MNWGKGIVLLFTAFVVGMLGMVFLAVSNDHQLVADDYYEQEVRYQQIIDQKKNVDLLTTKPEWGLSNGQLEIRLGSPATQGKVVLFRHSNDALDVEQPLVLNADGKHCIPTQQLSKGLYALKLSWQAADKDYYWEEDIYIQ